MFCSYRCCFTNKMTAGEIQSENKVPHIWVQNVLIYNIKTSQHTFWNTSLEDFHFPQTMCAAHGKMNFCCPWKPCKLELAESCAVSRPEECASVKYPPNKNTGPSENFPKHHKGCCPVADTAVNFSSAQFGLFRSEKLSFLTSRISSCIRLSQNQILPRGCKAWCTCGPFFSLELCKRFEVFFEIHSASWELLWGRRELCNREGRVSVQSAGLPGGYFTPDCRSLSVRGLKTGSRFTGIIPVK